MGSKLLGEMTPVTPSSVSKARGETSEAIISTAHSDPVHRGPRIRSNLRLCRTNARKESLRLGDKPPFRRAPPQPWIVSFATDFDVLGQVEF